MSKKDTQVLFKEIVDRLNKVQQFRRLTTNKKGHYIAVYVEELKEQLTFQVKSQQEDPDAPLPRGLQTLVDEEAAKLLDRLANDIQNQIDNKFGKRKVQETEFIHVKGKSFECAVEQQVTEGTANVFAVFGNACSRVQGRSVERINKKINSYKRGNLKPLQKSKNLVDVGHVGDTENLKQAIRATATGLIKTSEKLSGGMDIFFRSLGDTILLKLSQNPPNYTFKNGFKKGEEWIVLTLQSKRLNRDTVELQKLKADIEKIIDVFNSFFKLPGNIKGSDNQPERAAKVIVKETGDGIVKKAKASGGFDKIKDSGAKSPKISNKNIQQKFYNVKGNKGQPFKFFKPVQFDASQTSTPATTISLLTLLKLKLPATVAKNMGDPRLNYQTGRFAASVGVESIGQRSKKGPISVGYRYQTDPYDVFEEGRSKYQPERDPNDLIDKSIREIAAEIKITELTTRKMV